MDRDGRLAASPVGTTLGAYRILKRIGAGGMGVVYLAHDTRLDRQVALKALPAGGWSDPEARRKLLLEARHASRVVHPYVATVFDVLDHEGSLFIVMEHIEGRLLDDVLRADRPDTARILGYAIEIAEALIAIHDAGLIHRDLKPGNVMVTATGHVKVMDFGLAEENVSLLRKEPDTSGSTASKEATGRLAGTVRYMSPEQVNGSSLDARSDIFAFGVILWEALARRHPFERDTVLAMASAILRDRPAQSAREAFPADAAALASIVTRMLEKDPAARYPDAHALARDLRAAATEIHVDPESEPRSGRTRRLAVLAAALVALASGVILWRTGLSPIGAGFREKRPTLAVLPFEDRTGESGTLRGEMLADLLSVEQGDSALVRTLSSDRVQQILASLPSLSGRPQAIEKVAAAARVTWIVAGTLYREGEVYQATVGIYGSDPSSPLTTFRVSAGTTGALADRAAEKLREALFPEQAREEDTRPEPGVVATSDAAGLLEHDARKAIREMHYLDAIDMLARAVEIDSGFLLAQARLAEVLDLAGYGDRAREAAERARRGVERSRAGTGRLTLEVRAVTARVRGDAAAEVAARRELVARHRDDPAARVALADALLRGGNALDALSEADEATALDALDPQPVLIKARALSATGRWHDATVSLERADALFRQIGSDEGHAVVAKARGDLEFAQAHYVEAGKAYREGATGLAAAGLEMLAAGASKSAADTDLAQGNLVAAEAAYGPVLAAARAAGNFRLVIMTLDSLGAQYFVRGNLDKAERLLREATSAGEPLRNPLLLLGPTLNLASVLGYSGRDDECRVLAEGALTTARAVGNLNAQATALALLANADQRQGRLADAVRAYREILDSKDLSSAPTAPLAQVHQSLAEILLAQGRAGEARGEIDRALELNRKTGNRVMVAYALVSQANLLAELELREEGRKDLDEAESIVREQAGALEDLVPTIELVRGTIAAASGAPAEAESHLAAARAKAAAASGAGLGADVLSASCAVAFLAGKEDEAITFCRHAVDLPDALPSTRTMARAMLAELLASKGRFPAAETEARRARDEANAMSIPLAAARAASALLHVPQAAHERETVLRSGREALARYFTGIPPERLEAVRARADLHRIIADLER